MICDVFFFFWLNVVICYKGLLFSIKFLINVPAPWGTLTFSGQGHYTVLDQWPQWYLLLLYLSPVGQKATMPEPYVLKSIWEFFFFCLIKSSRSSHMKIEKQFPYHFFFLGFRVYKKVKFHFWFGCNARQAGILQRKAVTTIQDR